MEKDLEQSLIDEIEEDNIREDQDGYFHPSEITGCPLKVYLDKMTEVETTLSSWLMQGTAVHYWLQEDGVMDEALHEAGYHILDTEYEVRTYDEIEEDVTLTGQCDIIAHKDGKRYIFDIKYTSLRPSSNSERLYKYFSQANVYAHMFDADEYGLIIINSKSRDLLGKEDGKPDIWVLDGNEKSEENWGIVKDKAIEIHNLLKETGFYDGERKPNGYYEQLSVDDWHDIHSRFKKGTMPSYKKECNYCEHSDYCPIKNGNVKSGLDSFKGGV